MSAHALVYYVLRVPVLSGKWEKLKTIILFFTVLRGRVKHSRSTQYHFGLSGYETLFMGYARGCRFAADLMLLSPASLALSLQNSSGSCPGPTGDF
jgi:hypothetical protein